MKILKDDKREKIVLSNYLFLSALSGNIYFQPARTVTADGVSFPLAGDKYFLRYKSLFKNIIKKNNIKVIYIIEDDISDRSVKDYIEETCYIEEEKENKIRIFNLKDNC